MPVSRKKRVGFLLATFTLGIWLSAIPVSAREPAGPQISTGDVLLPLDTSNSKVHFTVNTTLHTVHGEFALKHGSVQFDPDTGKAAGEFVVDATTGQSGNASRDKRMQKEILESNSFTEVVFCPDRIIGKVALSGSSTVQVHGTFTLHGVNHELTIPVQVNISGEHWNSTATFTVPYIEWGLKNPSNFLFKVSPTVNVNLEMTGSFQPPLAHLPN